MEIGIPELDDKQIEELCSIVEKTARQYVLSKLSPKRIEALNISVETDGTKPVRLTVDVDVSLSPLMKKINVQKLVDEAIKEPPPLPSRTKEEDIRDDMLLALEGAEPAVRDNIISTVSSLLRSSRKISMRNLGDRIQENLSRLLEEEPE